MSSCRLTVVVDNNAENEFVAEHGFALLIETGDARLLLDSGQKDGLLPNLDRLNMPASSITGLVLSHGHYDHTGGVADLIRLNKKLELYLHAAVFQPRYAIENGEPETVKMPLASMSAIMDHPESRTHWLSKPMKINRSIGLTGSIARKTEFEDTGGPFFLDPQGRKPDTIIDDVAVYVHGREGLSVCVGCCHAGLVNTLEQVAELTGERRFHTVIGGLHLHSASVSRLEKTVEALSSFTIDRIVACHCTGEEPIRFLNSHLKTEVSAGYAGLVLEV